MFYFDEINGKRILKSDVLPNLQAFFTTRETVIRSNEIDLQNIVKENKELICKYLNVEDLISPIQTHSANVDLASENKLEYPNTDALILNNINQAIYLNFADCTPVILYDKKRHIAAVSHAGWRGTVQKIVPKTIEVMQSCSSDIIAVIGPAISICCYNVGEDVFQQLKSTVKNFDDLYNIKNGQIFVDLKRINARQLEEIGVKNIDICPYCTCCNNDMFFSYRKEHATTNRHSAVIKL